jgi:uncharacterized repeat protein (TIGR01451 family)
MSRRSSPWLPIFVVLFLMLQVVLPVGVTFAPSRAAAADITAPGVTTLGQPRLNRLSVWLAALGAHHATLASPFDSPLPTPPLTPTLTLTSPPLTSTPTPTPAQVEDETAALALSLTADPPWAAPDEVVTFTVTAANPWRAALPGLVLTDTLPAGLVYVAGSTVGFTDTPKANQLTWPAGELAAGAVITGSFQARVQDLALGETVTNTVTAAATMPRPG